MLYSLSASETNALTKYRFIDEIPKDRLTIPFRDVTDKVNVVRILERVGKQAGSPTNKVSASLIAKRMGFYAVIHLYAMSVLNKKLVVNVEEAKLVVRKDDPLWLPDFYFGDFTVEEAGEDRKLWRETVIREIFSGFLHPLIETLHGTTRFSKLVMWENVAVYLFWLYESILDNEEYREIHQRVMKDYQFLIYEANGILFGQHYRNPLSRFDSKKVFREEYDKMIRVRKTCCLSNLLEGKNEKRCSTCPNGCNMPPFKRVR